MKALGIDGPVLFPLAEDLPYLAEAAERRRAPGALWRSGAGTREWRSWSARCRSR